MYIYTKFYEENKESYPEWFKAHEQCLEFITNIRDKYLFEYVNMSNPTNPLAFPPPLRFDTLIKGRSTTQKLF